VVALAKSAGPVEMAGLELVQSPAALVFEAMMMSTRGAEVAVGGGSAVAVVTGVVLVRCAGRGTTADHDAGPVPGLQIAA
jgi:hypothetical protein